MDSTRSATQCHVIESSIFIDIIFSMAVIMS